MDVIEYFNKKNINKETNKIRIELQEAKSKHEVRVNLLKKGMTFDSAKYIDRKDIHDLIAIENRQYLDFLNSKYNELVLVENGVLEKDNEVEEPRTIKKRKLKSKKLIALGLGISAVVLGVSIYFKNKFDDEKTIYNKTKSYYSELQDVIKDSTHERIGNLDYVNGKLVQLDDIYYTGIITSYLDYTNIANYIQNSSNPDLALFTLYYGFGTQKGNPLYDKITNKTCKELTFVDEDTNTTYDNIDFKEYITLNGYDSYSDYKKKSEKELINDSDDILDNVKIKVKKRTN